VAFLDRGRIVALDTPATLKAEYGKDERTTLEDIFIQLTGSDLKKESEVL
jgi:ABC-type multidrug transport system ATPase subunit